MATETFSWRPSGDNCTLPADTTNVWKRLTELTGLMWPTLAEQVERKVLVDWLNPTSSGMISDERVLTTASNIHGVSLDSHDKFLQPVYAAASLVWQNLQRLGDGQELEVLRPELLDGDMDIWRNARAEQAHDWLSTVLRTLESLVDPHANAIVSFKLPDLVQDTVLATELRTYYMEEAFASPMAIGASMYRETGEGVAFGVREGHVSAMESLAFAMKQAVTALNETDPDGEKAFKTALMRVDFFWALLKGYTWAGTFQDSNLVYALSFPVFASVWSATQEALLLGRAALTVVPTDHPEPSLGGPRSAWFDSAYITSVEELIKRMEEYLAATRKSREINRRYR